MSFTPPMTMMEFFRKSEGTWFTQRTVHHFDGLSDEPGESNLLVTVIDKADTRVQEICAQQGITASRAAGGASFMWQDCLDEQVPNPDYTAVLIDIPDDETGRSGKLLRNQGYVEKIPVICRYWFGQDGILTIDTEYDNNQGQERCWFLSDNFRVRVTTARLMNGINLMAYCSERRCLSTAMLQQMVDQNLARAASFCDQ